MQNNKSYYGMLLTLPPNQDAIRTVLLRVYRNQGNDGNVGFEQLRLDWQPKLEQLRLEQPGLEQLQLEQPGLEQLQLEQPRLEQLRLEQLRLGSQPSLEQLRLEQLRLEQLHLKQQLRLELDGKVNYTLNHIKAADRTLTRNVESCFFFTSDWFQFQKATIIISLHLALTHGVQWYTSLAF